MALSPQGLGHRFDNIYMSGGSRAHLGDVHNITHIHSAAVVPAESPPVPLFTVPFVRDSDYIHRGRLSDEIHDKLSVPGARVALVGLGGVGKSQLAIEYGHRVRQESPSTWVLWLYASSAARFELSVRDILEQLRVLERTNPNNNVFQLLRSWLRDTKHGKWLIILDNADDADALLEPPSCTKQGGGPNQRNQSRERRLDYLPSSSHGSILVTSRSRDVALEIVDRKALIIVDPMDEKYAVQLVGTKLERAHSKENAIELARALDCMPLAITQAVAYIEHNPLCSVKQYLERLRQIDKFGRSLLDYEANDNRRDRDAKNSIFLTWQLSFKQIQRTRRSATDLLSLMSMFDRHSIPASLLFDWSRSNRHFSKAIADWVKKAISWRGPRFTMNSSTKAVAGGLQVEVTAFEEDLKILRDYSLISFTNGEANLQMHRLVQLAMQAWLESDGRLERWKCRFVTNLDAAFPRYQVKVEDWAGSRPLYPHAVAVLYLELHNRSATLRQASLFLKSGRFARNIGNYAHADDLTTRCLSLRKRLLGDEHPDTLISMNDLAQTYWNQGRLKEAEELQLKTLVVWKRLLGNVHPQTLISMNDLAQTYWRQGRLKEAEELQLKTLDVSKRLLGDENPNTLDSMNSLAVTYQRQGRLEEAEELQWKTLDTSKRSLGDEHPDTLISMNDLAQIYWSQGRLDEAEKLHVKTLDVRKRLLGDEHPDTLISMHHLACTYHRQGRLKRAEELQLKTLEVWERLLGDEHPGTLNSMHQLAWTYRSQGQLKEAEEMQLKTLDVRKRLLGDEHPDTLASMHHLAWTYRCQGRLKEAEELQLKTLEMQKRLLGNEHPDTLDSIAHLAIISQTIR